MKTKIKNLDQEVKSMFNIFHCYYTKGLIKVDVILTRSTNIILKMMKKNPSITLVAHKIMTGI